MAVACMGEALSRAWGIGTASTVGCCMGYHCAWPDCKARVRVAGASSCQGRVGSPKFDSFSLLDLAKLLKLSDSTAWARVTHVAAGALLRTALCLPHGFEGALNSDRPQRQLCICTKAAATQHSSGPNTKEQDAKDVLSCPDVTEPGCP